MNKKADRKLVKCWLPIGSFNLNYFTYSTKAGL
jgi:hypothetical protein